MSRTKAASSRDLSSVELAWLRVESPESPSVNTVALIVDGSPDLSRLKERIEDRLLPLDRLRQRLESSPLPLARPRWRDHDEFQLTDHLFVMEPAASEPPPTLGALVDRVLSLPMDQSLPLWQIHLLELAGGRAAVILRVHGTLADSRASAALAFRLLDGDGQKPPPASGIGLEHRLPLHDLLDAQRSTATATRMLCQLITERADRDNPFRHSTTRVRTAGWSEPVILEQLEKLSHEHGFTSTELLLATIGGALRKAAHRLDTPADTLEVRAVLPIDIRRPDDQPLGTRSALGLLRLPVQDSAVSDRLERVHQEIERFSMKPENLAVLGLDGETGLSMTEIEERSIRLLCHKASVALALLDGPAQRQSLCDQEVSQIVWWPALNKKMALGISVVAYAGQIRFGVSCDDALRIDAAALASDMAAEITGA